MAWRTGSSGTVPFGSEHLVEYGAGLLGELGPFGWPRVVGAGLEHPVGDGDLAAGQVGLGAPSGPGRTVAVVAVEVGFDLSTSPSVDRWYPRGPGPCRHLQDG